MQKIIEISNLKKEIKIGHDNVEILKDINLEVKKGEFLAIKGASGSGKSTLLSILAGIDSITQGRVIVCGNEISNYNENKLAQYRNNKIEIVFQNFNLIHELTAFENILVPSFFRRYNKNTYNRVYELIEIVGMTGEEKLYPAQLSGGEQQKEVLKELIGPDRLAEEQVEYVVGALKEVQTVNVSDAITFQFKDIKKNLMLERLTSCISTSSEVTFKYRENTYEGIPVKLIISDDKIQLEMNHKVFDVNKIDI